MIFIKLDFPTGHWHATAWGTHVNESIPEWPPCPWRLCRSFIATWFWKFRNNPDCLRGLIEKLAAQNPDYFLPEATAAHTRHYMPVVEGPKESKTKIFDTFVQVKTGESLWIRWDVDLTSDESKLLGDILLSMNYMGRAESLICASLQTDFPDELKDPQNTPPDKAKANQWTTPIDNSKLGDHGEIVRLLGPQLPEDYAKWASAQTPAPATAKKSKKKTTALPDSLFSALQTDTADWKKEGWNLPPGSRWVEYSRPRDCFKIAPHRAISTTQNTLPTVARFAIVSKVPPSITQSLSLAERFHQALCKILNGQFTPAITGKSEQGTALEGNEHVFFLPEADQHGYVTHMTLFAPMGFDPAACHALNRLRKVWGMEGFDVKIVLLATGQPEDFTLASPYFRPSKTWVSLTPFIPVRHPKATRAGVVKTDAAKNGLQIGSAEQDCWRLLEMRFSELNASFEKLELKSAAIANILLTEGDSSPGTKIQFGLRNISCLDFQRDRHTGKGARAGDRGYSMRLEFSEAVSLPFGLGYAAHFGLGLFIPV